SSRPKKQKARITAPSGRALLNLSSRSVQLEGGVQSTHGQLQVLLLDDHRDLDLGGGDHLDVDGFLGQGLEHAAGDTGMGTHADADDGNLGDVDVTAHLACAQLARG